MQIQVNTDDHIPGREDMIREVEGEVSRFLQRFATQVTRVEVHLSDVNASKEASGDKRCMMEARPAGRQPEAVTHQADTVGEAVAGAAKKLQARLETVFGRANATKGRASIRDNEHS